MGLYARLFVKIEEDKKFLGIQKAMEAVNEFYLKKFNEALECSPYENRVQFNLESKDEDGRYLWSRPQLSSYDGEVFLLCFKINGESKTLYIMTNIKDEHQRIIGNHPALWFSQGGTNRLTDELMKVIATPLKKLGDVYYDFNDCDEKDFIKI